MAQSARTNLDVRRSSFATWFTFLVGAPLGIGSLLLIRFGPWQNPTVQRYVQHLAEQAVVVIFFCCFAALVAKLLGAVYERYMQGQNLLPGWDGKPMLASDVTKLQQKLHLAWDGAKSTYIGRRIANILSFVHNRGTADDLDDQMRTLADNDAMTLDGTYALNRFLIWAMPILGFLGTVLGITDAIGGINPAELDKGGGADNVTQGLTKAFDATALALALTLIAMFFNYLVEKLEQNLLERVDQFVDAELAHRFVRTQSNTGTPLDMPNLIQQLTQKQISLWEAAMQKAEERWQQTPQHDHLVQALDATLTRFGQRIVETEKKLLERHQALIDGLAKFAASASENGREHQTSLARLTDAINLSIELIVNVQSSETQLIRLQEALNQNLGLLANSATFKQAVESLTAAIALLTTRVSPAQQATPRIVPMHKDAA